MAKTDSLAVAKLSSSVADSRSSSSIGSPRVAVGSLQQVLKKKKMKFGPGLKIQIRLSFATTSGSIFHFPFSILPDVEFGN